ncbi:hypothetical protein LTR09_011303 [Extremus antarcticus]|uniref:Uncharacterized protein n=1 Tax=Extremus antarcticus TaxID=702011 RepID=A0AAJ0GAH9_9PEZI|nr:hypothetical protein LTR09_011303 [Extremus antarcticus]
MPSSPPDKVQLPGAAAGLPSGGLIAVAWAGFALAACFVTLRSYARLTETHRLHADDYWILVALFFLLANAILQTLQTHSLYYIMYGGVGIVPIDATYMVEGNIYVRYEFTIIALFWSVTWSVKSSFLALY